MKHEGLGITDPWVLEERVYNTSKSASEFLVGSLLGVTNLNYIYHKGFVCTASADGKKQRELAVKVVLSRRKVLVDRVGFNCLRLATENRAWLTAIPCCLN